MTIPNKPIMTEIDAMKQIIVILDEFEDPRVKRRMFEWIADSQNLIVGPIRLKPEALVRIHSGKKVIETVGKARDNGELDKAKWADPFFLQELDTALSLSR